jgi:hypothetical protein
MGAGRGDHGHTGPNQSSHQRRQAIATHDEPPNITSMDRTTEASDRSPMREAR